MEYVVFTALVLMGYYLLVDGLASWNEESGVGPALRTICGALCMVLAFGLALWSNTPQEVRIPQKAAVVRTELVNTETGVDTVLVYLVRPAVGTAE